MNLSQIFINGQWVPAASKTPLKIINPATLETLGLVPDCDATDVDRAVTAAANAQTAWAQTPGTEKAVLLRQIGTDLRRNTREIANLMTQETGKPISESIDCLDWVAACFEYYAEVGRSNCGSTFPPVAPNQVNFTIKEPYGVVAAIVPFNFPLLLMAWKVAPALAAGNTLVCKAPHQNPLSNLLMARAYSNLPPGVVNVITGSGTTTGEALIHHKKVDLIAFTGSTEVGRHIAATAGRQLKKVNLELGGIDPLIVFKDADLDVASKGAAWARLLNAGQVCTSSKRIYVERAVYAEFKKKVLDFVQSLKVGNPSDPTTDIGPLISEAAVIKVSEQTQRAISEGAKCLMGGKRMKADGFFFEPTVLETKHGSLLTREEVFGPVISLIEVADANEAIRCANDSEFGLGATIYTKSLETSMHAMREIKAGTFWINDPLTDNDAAPFGGMRHSGVGRELGEEGLEAFREPKHVHLEYKMEAKSYWFPYAKRKLSH